MVEAIGLVAADERLGRALRNALERMPTSARRRFVLQRAIPRRASKQALARLLFISWARDLTVELRSHVGDVPRRWEGYLVFVDEDTPAEALSQITRLRVQDPSRLQFVTAADDKQAAALLGAFLERLNHCRDSEGVLHAWWADGSLELLTTAFRRISVSQSSIVPLQTASGDDCRDLEVGFDGSYLAWPSLDVHMGFEQFEELVSPELALRRRQENDEFNQRYGAGIRAVRLAHGLKQSDIEGLTPRHVGRIERGEVRATAKALRTLALAHGLSPSDYLAEVATALDVD